MNEKRFVEIRGRKFVFIHNEKTANFEKDLAIVSDILEKDNDHINMIDRFNLLRVYHASYHKSGKIEEIMSYDSTATNCEYCQLMREAAANNPLHICNYCYDKAQEESYKGVNVLNRHTLNMIIFSEVEFTVDELKILPCGLRNRINSSGDVPNKTYAKNSLNLAYAFPAARFTLWAKNTVDVIAACDEIGKPANMRLIQSSPIIGKPAKLAKYFDCVFTVYATKEETAKAIANGAKACNGKKCKDCGFRCYDSVENGGWEAGSNIAEYLRIAGLSDDKRGDLVK